MTSNNVQCKMAFTQKEMKENLFSANKVSVYYSAKYRVHLLRDCLGHLNFNIHPYIIKNNFNTEDRGTRSSCYVCYIVSPELSPPGLLPYRGGGVCVSL